MQFPPAALRIAHHEHVADGINNGHTIQINYAGADTLTIGDDTYELVQYHFHNQSEHTVKGKHFPMEMHLVHKSADGKLAVIGVFIEEGAHNAAFDPDLGEPAEAEGRGDALPAVTVDVERCCPPARTSYRYDGSLTTPPCSEGVRWIVMTTPIQLSASRSAHSRADPRQQPAAPAAQRARNRDRRHRHPVSSRSRARVSHDRIGDYCLGFLS